MFSTTALYHRLTCVIDGVAPATAGRPERVPAQGTSGECRQQ
jgi:hypothetical protein